MDPALFEAVLRQCRELGTFRAVLCGYGEPALHPQFDRMLGLMMQLGLQPYVLTNGIGIDEARARFWATTRTHFRFSVHAGDIETWLRVHPAGTSGQFEQLSRTIRLLVAAGTPHVSILHVIHRANFRRMREMIEQAHDLGVRELLFRPARAEGELAEVVLSPDEEAALRAELPSHLKLAEGYGVRTNLTEYFETNLRTQAGVVDTTELYRHIPCYLGWIYAEVDIDGTVTPCIGSSRVMGRVGEQPFGEIWRSERYQAFRREARSMPRRGTPVEGCKCSSCLMSKYNMNVHNLLHLKSLRYSDA
jgi:radical SAM protein with 4Fe4S-binding SPASM domain